MQNSIIHLLEHSRDRFKRWLGVYRPWHGVNGITERNLSFQLATSFLAEVDDGIAFMEVPFAISEKGRTNQHLDAYLLSRSLALLVEAKIVYANTHIGWIKEDIDRMSPALIQQVRARHKDVTPERTHGVVIAETWRAEIAAWWTGDDGARQGWDRSPLPATWHYGFLKVLEVSPGREGTLYWLYAISPDLTPTPPDV